MFFLSLLMKSEERVGDKHIEYVFFYLEVCISSKNTQLCAVLQVTLKKKQKIRTKKVSFSDVLH